MNRDLYQSQGEKVSTLVADNKRMMQHNTTLRKDSMALKYEILCHPCHVITLASVLSYLMSESCPRTGACPKFLQSRLSQSSARRVWGRANYIIIARYDATLFLHSSLLLVSPSPRLRSLPRPWSPHPTSCPCSSSIDLSTGKH